MGCDTSSDSAASSDMAPRVLRSTERQFVVDSSPSSSPTVCDSANAAVLGALVVSLKKDAAALKEENATLRKQLAECGRGRRHSKEAETTTEDSTPQATHRTAIGDVLVGDLRKSAGHRPADSHSSTHSTEHKLDTCSQPLLPHSHCSPSTEHQSATVVSDSSECGAEMVTHSISSERQSSKDSFDLSALQSTASVRILPDLEEDCDSRHAVASGCGEVADECQCESSGLLATTRRKLDRVQLDSAELRAEIELLEDDIMILMTAFVQQSDDLDALQKSLKQALKPKSSRSVVFAFDSDAKRSVVDSDAKHSADGSGDDMHSDSDWHSNARFAATHAIHSRSISSLGCGPALVRHLSSKSRTRLAAIAAAVTSKQKTIRFMDLTNDTDADVHFGHCQVSDSGTFAVHSTAPDSDSDSDSGNDSEDLSADEEKEGELEAIADVSDLRAESKTAGDYSLEIEYTMADTPVPDEV